MWGEQCRSLEDMSKVFVNYLTGKIKKFPFAENPIAAETADISQILLEMNQSKMLTVNSQPRVNGVKSTDLKFGWGPENGHVYQKAYYEFFVHPSVLTPLIHHLEQHPDISYQAINSKGEKLQNIAEIYKFCFLLSSFIFCRISPTFSFPTYFLETDSFQARIKDCF